MAYTWKIQYNENSGGIFESFDHNILEKLQKRGGVEGGLCNLNVFVEFF